MNPRISFGQGPPEPPLRGTVPWWEAIPWACRACVRSVRRVGLMERRRSALVVELTVMLGFAIAGLVLGCGR